MGGVSGHKRRNIKTSTNKSPYWCVSSHTSSFAGDRCGGMERTKQSRVIGISDSVNPPTDPIPDAVMSCYGCNQSGKRQMTLRAQYVISIPG